MRDYYEMNADKEEDAHARVYTQVPLNAVPSMPHSIFSFFIKEFSFLFSEAIPMAGTAFF